MKQTKMAAYSHLLLLFIFALFSFSSGTQLILVNKCNESIWSGLLGGAGHHSPEDGDLHLRGRGSSSSRGSHEDFSAKESPQLYYKKSMVLNPWMHLKPIVWSSTVPSKNPMSLIKSPTSWLPKSLSADKAKSSGSSSMKFRPKSRLAKCLSYAFEEAVKETDDC